MQSLKAVVRQPLPATLLHILQLVSMKRKWVICKGATVQDEAIVASVTRQTFSMHGGVEVRMPGSDEPQYTLRQQGIITGRREVDIMHKGRLIGQVCPAKLPSAHCIYFGSVYAACFICIGHIVTVVRYYSWLPLHQVCRAALGGRHAAYSALHFARHHQSQQGWTQV